MKRNYIYWIFIGILIQFSSGLHAGEKIDESVNLGGSRQATWYLPDEPSTGWVLLQHGFQRNKSNLDDIATHLMDNGLMVLTINSSVSNGNPSLAKDVADDLIDSPPTPPNGITLPQNLVIAGHSAGGLFMSHLGARLMERNYPDLHGAILFDPVDASNALQGNAQSMLDNQVSVLSILANSSSCNSSNNALQPLQNLSAEFVGIKLTNDSKHTDVEGSSTGGIITWLCGTPKSYNVTYVKDYTLNWAQDMINQTYTSDYYPGGAKLSQLIADNDGILLKELSTNPPSADFSFTVNELNVSFSNQSSDSDGTVVSYEWQFGDGQTSNLENPSHSYNSAGTYTVSLVVTDNDGQTGSVSKNVTVTQDSNVPTANFTFSQNDLSVDFTDTSTDVDGTIDTWLWTFGDGQTSTTANPSHTYASAGTYTVTLDVSDNDGLTDTTSQQVTVSIDDGFLDNNTVVENLSAARNEEIHFKMNVPADANDLEFAISGGSGDADIYVRYAAVPTTREYDYRPYKYGNDETVSVAEPQTGVWYLMIRGYQNFSGVTLTASYKTSENQAPTASFTQSINQLNVSFIDASTDPDGTIVSRLWTFGDGNESNQQNPTYSYAQPGTYNVTLAVTDDKNATDMFTRSIVVDGDIDDIVELNNGDVIADLSAARTEELHFVLRNVPPQTVELVFAIQGGSGDADIYVRYGSRPTTSEYDYRPYLGGNNENVRVQNPQAGDWYVMVRAYQAFSGVTLSASHTAN